MVRYDDDSGSFGCLGWITLAGLLMIALRWLGVINWSWWIVLAPLYLPPAFLIILFIIEIIQERRKNK